MNPFIYPKKRCRYIVLIGDSSEKWSQRDIPDCPFFVPKTITHQKLGEVSCLSLHSENLHILLLRASVGLRSKKNPHPIDYIALLQSAMVASDIVKGCDHVYMPKRTCYVNGGSLERIKTIFAIAHLNVTFY